jgi:hypothetical protein
MTQHTKQVATQATQDAPQATRPSPHTAEEHAAQIVRTSAMANELEDTINKVEELLQDLKLDTRSWSPYAEFMDAAWSMHTHLRYLGSDDNLHLLTTRAEALAYLKAHGWKVGAND